MNFERIGQFAARYRYLIIVIWIAAAVGLTVFSPQLADVTTSDLADLLSDEAPYHYAQDVVETAFPGSEDAGGLVLVIESETDILNRDAETFAGQIDTAPAKFIAELGAWLLSDEGPSEISAVTLPVSSSQVAEMTIDNANRVAMVPITLTDNSLGTNGNYGAFSDSIDDWIDTNAPEGIQTYMTGTVSVIAMTAESIVNTVQSTLFVTLALVVVLLILIYRSPVSPFIPLTAVTLSYLITRGLVAFLAEDLLTVSSYADILLVVVIYGAGTDYCLFLISRFREEMADKPTVAQATKTTIEKAGETIASSAGTVFVGFVSMIFAEFGLFNTSGPALAIGIAVSLLAGLTFVPAVLAVLGNRVFWPGGAKHRSGGRFFQSVSALVARYPLLVLIAIIALMVPLAIHGMGVELDYDMLSELPEDVETRAGFDVLEESLGAGNLAPLTIVATDRDPATMSAEIVQLEADLLALDNVADVRSLNNPVGQAGQMTQVLRADTQLYLIEQLLMTPAPEGQEPDPEATAAMLQGLRGYVDTLAAQFPELADDANLVTLQTLFGDVQAFSERQAEVPGALEGLAARFAAVQQPYVSIGALAANFDPQSEAGVLFSQLLGNYMTADGTGYRMSVTLKESPFSADSLDMALDIRSLLIAYEQDGDAVVDGQSVMLADVRDVLNDDLVLTVGLVSLGIFIVLLLMLRSIISPLYLIITVGLNYVFTLGLTDLVFRTVFDSNGLSFILPIFAFVFLVALGIDYSIFLLGRVKEEVGLHGIHEGVHQGIISTGPVIVSAGIILAGTFAAMMTGEITALAQLGFAVAAGVLFDTVVVRTMLVSSLTILMGKWAWWPGGVPRASQAPVDVQQPAPASGD